MKKTYRFLFGAIAAVALASCGSSDNKLEQRVTPDMLTVTIGGGQKIYTKNQATYFFDLYNPNNAQFSISSLNLPTTSINNVTFSDLTFGVMQGPVGDGSTTGTGYKFKRAATSTCPALNGYDISDFNVYLGGYNYLNASFSITLDNNTFITGFAANQMYFTKTSVSDMSGSTADFTTFGPKNNVVFVAINADKRTADVTISQAKFSDNQTAEDIVYRNIPVDIDASRLTINTSDKIVPTKTNNNDTTNAEPLPAYTADSFMIILNVCYSAQGTMQIKIGDKLVNAALVEFLPASTVS